MRYSLKLGLTVFILVGVGGIMWSLNRTAEETKAAPGGPLMPALTGMAGEGAPLFAANCAQCHGESLLGTDKGPPLLHIYYETGHHGDSAFRSAIRLGVRAHHWPFGDMPAQPQVGAEDVERIIAFVRTVQRANGIH